MKPPPFAYASPDRVDEAVTLLARSGGGAKILAGGQSLVPMLNFRLLAPSLLVDLNRIPALRGIEERDGALRIGAMTRHSEIERSELIERRLPVLGAAVRHVAHLAIRNRGTIGGSLAHADPAAELPLVALLLDASIGVTGSEGERTLPARDFFRAPLTTALDDDEVLTHLDLRFPAPETGWGFEERARRSGDFALAAAATTLRLDGNRDAEARIAEKGAHPTPVRIESAEARLAGQTPDDDAIDDAAETARSVVEPEDDLHASADFRRHLVGVLTRRALRAAVGRARGEAA